MNRRIEQIKNDKGFTLVEVIAAFAVMTLITSSILQMFVLSKNINKKAFDIDRANALAVKCAEIFKAGPDTMQTDAMFVSDLLNTSNNETFNKNNVVFAKYYDNNWNVLKVNNYNSVSSLNPIAPSGAFYRLDATVNKPSTAEGSTGLFYPDPCLIYTLNASVNDYTINISNNSGVYSIGINSDLPVLDSTKIKSNIPVKIIFPQNGQYPKHLTVNNGTALEVAFYFFDVPPQSQTGMPFDQAVQLLPAKGPCSGSYGWLSNGLTKVESRKYTLTVNITRLSDNFKLLGSSGYVTDRYFNIGT